LERTCRIYGLDPDDLENLRGHHLPMQRRGMRMAADGSALVGDAAGLVDPLSGEGIYAALLSGTAVAAPVRRYLDGDRHAMRGHHLPMQRRGMRMAADGSALVGDAAGLVDPLSGEGIYAALMSGTAVAAPVRRYLDGDRHAMRDYEAVLERDLLPEVQTSAAL